MNDPTNWSSLSQVHCSSTDRVDGERTNNEEERAQDDDRVAGLGGVLFGNIAVGAALHVSFGSVARLSSAARPFRGVSSALRGAPSLRHSTVTAPPKTATPIWEQRRG
jgi:hypothetical protein